MDLIIWTLFFVGSLTFLIDWRRLLYEKPHNLNTSSHIVKMVKSRRMRLAGDIARMGEMRSAYEILDGKPEGKRPLERLWRRWKFCGRIGLREMGREVVEWIHLAQNRNQWL
jgi:hypothetical protein